MRFEQTNPHVILQVVSGLLRTMPKGSFEARFGIFFFRAKYVIPKSTDQKTGYTQR